MRLFKRKKKKRACIIGLDGVPYPLLLNLTENGVMPNFAEIIKSGHLHKMKASLPEISAVSWTDFMTGTNSGTHGIFGFTDFKKKSYKLRFPNYLDLKTPTLWDDLARKNKKCVVINQPSTYPARKINGILISGFVAIELSKAIYPMSLKPALEKINYEIDIDTFKCREDHDLLWKELINTLNSREKAFDLLWNKDWDYFELVITGTDRLQHFLWNAYQDNTHPNHQNFLDYYHQVDILIGKILNSYRKLTGDEEGLFLLSDHGFTGIEQEVYLNAWLEKEGYLKFKSPEPKGLEEISPSSRAFAMDPNRIYLHLLDKFPHGCVKESEKAALKQEITSKLKQLKYQEKEVINEIFDSDIIYSGPWISSGPDLIAVANHGFDMKGSVKKKEIFGRSNLQGMHTWDEAFFWAKQNFGQKLCISDLAAIITKNFE